MYHSFPRSIMLNGPLKGKGFLALTLSSLQDNKNLHGQSNDYMVILSCGCSLTLCLLTVLITTFHYLEARCRLILMHTQISLTMGLIMIVIILKIAIFQQVCSTANSNGYRSESMHFLQIKPICVWEA